VSIWCLLRKIPICVGLFVEKDLHRQGVYLYSSPYSECVAYWHLPSTARDMWLKPVTHKRAMTRMYCTHTLPSTIAEVQAGPKMILPTLPLHLTSGHGDMTHSDMTWLNHMWRALIMCGDSWRDEHMCNNALIIQVTLRILLYVNSHTNTWKYSWHYSCVYAEFAYVHDTLQKTRSIARSVINIFLYPSFRASDDIDGSKRKRRKGSHSIKLGNLVIAHTVSHAFSCSHNLVFTRTWRWKIFLCTAHQSKPTLWMFANFH